MPPSDDATWDARDWQPQHWDGERWVDADGAEVAAPDDGGDGDDWEESWEYADPEAARRRQTIVVAGAVASALLLLAAVVVFLVTGQPAERSTASGPATTAGTAPGTTAPARKVSPLTGLAADATKLGRPALVVKVDNADAKAHPPSGINQADIVFEEKVEGATSRFAAVFQSADAARVGPVRSGRLTDLSVLTMLNQPLFAFSGANTVFRPQIAQAAIVDLGADQESALYTRDQKQQAPYNLYTDTAKVYAARPGGSAPKPVFPYRKSDAGPKNGRPVDGVEYQWGGGKGAVSFRWDATKRVWQRSQAGEVHKDADGVPIAPTNVVVLMVEYVDSGVRDTAGAAVPTAQFDGEGDALVFTDGQLVQGRWSKPNEDEAPVITDGEGNAIALTPGTTWVSLVPKGLANVVNRTDTPGQPKPSGAR